MPLQGGRHALCVQFKARAQILCMLQAVKDQAPSPPVVQGIAVLWFHCKCCTVVRHSSPILAKLQKPQLGK